MSDRTTVDWFRKPGRLGQDDPGTLNACFNALDRHVIRGRADEVAATLAGRDWTYAELLSEVGAFGGALCAFGVGVDDTVVVGRLPPFEEVVASLAVARLGAVRWYADRAVHDLAVVAEAARPRVVVVATMIGVDLEVDLVETPVITVDESGELSWDTVRRAGQSDPAACADVRADAALAILDGRPIGVLDMIGTAGVTTPAPRGASLIDVGGVALWSFEPEPTA